jgi:hypothetical protein
MTTVYRSAKDRIFTITFADGEGEAVTPVAASYAVTDEDGTDIVTNVAVDVSGSPATADVTVTALQNTLEAGSIRGFRTLLLSFTDGIGNSYEQKITYILEEATLMEVGTNSFARYEQFVLLLSEMPSLKTASAASERELIMALINAYYNIGNLNVNFGADLPDVFTTLDIGSAGLIVLPSKVITKLKKACLLEADSILGGNPVEDRRRMGLMSHSAGESAHFFRPTRPLELPVCKEAARVLSPHVRYVLKTQRL